MNIKELKENTEAIVQVRTIDDIHFLVIPYIIEELDKGANGKPTSSSAKASGLVSPSPYKSIFSRPVSKYDGIFNKFEMKARHVLISFLSENPLFKTWSSTALRKLLSNVGKLHFRKNQLVYKQNEQATAFYIVYRGEFAMK